MSDARAPASVEVEGLTFHYPGAEDPALREVAFRVRPGERLGLLGPNGAGKSTMMRIACGYLPVPRRRGTKVQVAGLDVATQSLAVREQVGYLPEQVPLYQELRVREHLEFRAAVKRVRRRKRRAEVERVAGLAGLEDMLETPIGRLSRGYRQRVGIADALLGSPPLVVLDEPTVGLDPNQVQGIRTMLKNLGGAQTLIFSSHILAEVEALCDRIIILSRGAVVADETVSAALASDTLSIEWGRPTSGGGEGEAIRGAAVRACLDQAWSRFDAAGPLEVELNVNGDRVQATVVSGPVPLDELAAAIGAESLAAGLPLVRLEPGRRRLEERFAVVTGFREAPERAKGGRS